MSTNRLKFILAISALLLPLRQAMAVAAQVPDRELLICYADYGTERVEPQWLSE